MGNEITEKPAGIDDLRREFDKSMRALRPKQRKFVRAYIKCGNMTQAALDAGYSEKSARNHGNRMMNKDANVQNAVRLAERLEALEHGIPLSMKREILMNTIARAQSEEFFNAGGIKSCVELLAKLDRDVMTPEIVIQQESLPIMNIVHAHEPVPPSIVNADDVIDGEVVEVHQGDDVKAEKDVDDAEG